MKNITFLLLFICSLLYGQNPTFVFNKQDNDTYMGPTRDSIVIAGKIEGVPIFSRNQKDVNTGFYSAAPSTFINEPLLPDSLYVIVGGDELLRLTYTDDSLPVLKFGHNFNTGYYSIGENTYFVLGGEILGIKTDSTKLDSLKKVCEEQGHISIGAGPLPAMFCTTYLIETDSTTIMVYPPFNWFTYKCARCGEIVEEKEPERRVVIWRK